MCNWLHICGFKMTMSRKGIYYDGHEREDVVEVCFVVAYISYLEIFL